MKTKGKKGGFFVFLGILLLFAALLVTGYNLLTDYFAGRNSCEIVENMDRSVSANIDNSANKQPKYILNPDMEMPVLTIDGIDYIGKISIEALDIELPVTSKMSYKYLENAACRYEGSIYLNNMIIAGHNYSSLFKNLKNAGIGDEIVFTDVEGNIFRYNVVETEILKPTDVEKMKSGNWDLTIFTCTVGGRSRLAVRCESV